MEKFRQSTPVKVKGYLNQRKQTITPVWKMLYSIYKDMASRGTLAYPDSKINLIIKHWNM